MPELASTNRAYTLKLSGNDKWRNLLWNTHVAVNRGAQVWGDWLLTLRGGLSATFADKRPERRVLLALSWLSVESPVSLVPHRQIVLTKQIEGRFHEVLDRLKVKDRDEWLGACLPALTARIRDDAVWVDRSQCFTELQKQFTGLTTDWAASTLFDFLGGEDDYFSMPEDDAPVSAVGKDFVQKAGGWLSRNWGAGEKSNSIEISNSLARLASVNQLAIVEKSGIRALSKLLETLGQAPSEDADAEELFKQLKQTVGWKGRPSKGAMALEKIRDAKSVSADLWQQTIAKLNEESADQSSKGTAGMARPEWMERWRAEMESRLGMPYRTNKDLIWEHGVTLDHALRRVSAAHTWIKRAEVERLTFQKDAHKLDDSDAIPDHAKKWLDIFRDVRSKESGALVEYLIRKRAIDGWEKVVQAWANLGPNSTRRQRIDAAREVQANLDDNEKFGDIQLFAGFGDEDDDSPRPCLADDAAACVWQDTDGRPNAGILRDYVSATVARFDQLRFKVPAFRHPDPLRHPVYVDFGKSRWGIAYSALNAYHGRQKQTEQLAKAKTDKARERIRQQLDSQADLRSVSLDIWNGETVESVLLHWHGKRLWKDLDLQHFGRTHGAAIVSRADRLGRVVGKQGRKSAVSIAEVFGQKDWNGRLQVPREQLDCLADLVYGKQNGKRIEPDYSKLDGQHANPRAHKMWERLNWFLTTSAKLKPHGPWLDYVDAGLPEGIQYKKGRNGYYVDYAVNKERKSRARLQLARLPGLRVLSLDLGHRYAAACAVWETITREQMVEACRAAGHSEPTGNEFYIHIRRRTDKIQKSGRNKGQPVTTTTIYRRVGPDLLPDGTPHPAPWARLERQFLIELQGEDRPARRARTEEIANVNEFRKFLGLAVIDEVPRIDDLQRDAIQIARLGLRRLGEAARIAFAMTATKKPISGGRELDIIKESQKRIDYLQDALILWQGLAKSSEFKDEWANQVWQSRVVAAFNGPPPVEIATDVTRSERKKKIEGSRKPLQTVAEQLADPNSHHAIDLHRQWSDEWDCRRAQWQAYLRWLRRFILPRSGDYQKNSRAVRQMGGLSIKRLQTIRSLYQVLKAFRMRPEPHNLRENIPKLGDESLANFGRRILNQLERLREQRIKQLASRVVEAALGAGRMKKTRGRDRKRPEANVDQSCHAVVVENLEHYRPEDSRLRRVNRRLMDWTARNVRKYIMEGCELHGLHFVEVPPAYTSKQDSRTGAPGIRCEDVQRKVLQEAARRVRAADNSTEGTESPEPRTQFEREVRRWIREFRRIDGRIQDNEDISPRDQVLAAIRDGIADLPASHSIIRLPRRGGELFVSVAPESPAAGGVQADLNAAANIGLKALMDPDWPGAWWFVLVNLATGQAVPEKVQGCPLWSSSSPVWSPAAMADSASEEGQMRKRATKSQKRKRTEVYAWNSLLWSQGSTNSWWATKPYWDKIEKVIADRLRLEQTRPETPF